MYENQQGGIETTTNDVDVNNNNNNNNSNKELLQSIIQTESSKERGGELKRDVFK